jgi:hypothetical protein
VKNSLLDVEQIDPHAGRAMQLGLTDHDWTIGELVAAALDSTVSEPPSGHMSGPFRVIDDGRE